MKLIDITPEFVRKLTNKQVLEMHRKVHMLYVLAKRRENQKQIKFLKDKHRVLVGEMEKRKMRHQSNLSRSMRMVEAVQAKMRTQFIVHDHEALRAGKHQDLRIKIESNKWDSFAVPKGVPLKPGVRVLAIKTHSHSNKEAMFTGTIPKGEYGGGTLKEFDRGPCILEKYNPAHIAVTFKGKKIKGLYHLISTGVVDKKKYKQQQYLLFKSKKYQEIK